MERVEVPAHLVIQVLCPPFGHKVLLQLSTGQLLVEERALSQLEGGGSYFANFMVVRSMVTHVRMKHNDGS